LVQAGAPLVEIGDPLNLEVVADLLSADATQFEKGVAVRIDLFQAPIRSKPPVS
jgi:HlyD family secretion protein